MIDCLSNTCWINPQIDVLLCLQKIRVCHSDIIDKFFLSITIFGEFWLPTLVCAITYWCLDFRAGIYLFSLESFNIFLTHLFKMMACVYRPWVLDSRIQPSALAVPFAKGYSFPSGHSAMSSSVLGGVAFLLKQKKLLCISLICLILLIGFSRLWLGVHTPQDVVCGLTIGLVLIFAVNKIINWAEINKNRYLYLTVFIDILAVLALIYVCFFNTYRINYVDGELLVNPIKSIYLTCIVYGYALGMINGCFLCRRFFPFNPHETSVKTRLLRGAVGITVVILMLKFVLGFIVTDILAVKPSTVIMFFAGLFITLIYPMIFTFFERLFLKK